MARRIKPTKSLFSPLAENFVKRLSAADRRLRRKIVRYAYWAVGLFFVYSLMSGNYGLPRIIRLEMEREALLDANRRLTANIIDGTRVKKMLRSDRQYLETVARTRYRMVYPGEILYQYR